VLVNLLRVAFAGTLVAATVSAAPVPAERAKAEKELAAVAAKLHGSWRGGPCVGCLTFRANGTFEWTGIGPGGDSKTGNWFVRGEALAPILILKCVAADDEEEKGKATEYKLVQMDAASFAFKYPEREKPQVFERAEVK